jgi:4-amino-4-deoxychorismate lyase
VPATTPVLLADDLGLTRGDGCFDATRVVVLRGTDGHAYAEAGHLDAHLDRFAASADALELPPPDLAGWRALIEESLSDWAARTIEAGSIERAPTEAVLKLILTRGSESAESHHSASTGLLTITALTPSTLAARRGIDVVTLTRGYPIDAFSDAPWLLGGVKSLSYAVNAAAKREAARRGADDVLFLSAEGYALEGPTSSLVVDIDGDLVTPPTGATGILASVTVEAIFAAASAGDVRTSTGLLTHADIHESRGAWLVSSVRGVAPIRSLDGVALDEAAELDARVTAWADSDALETLSRG